MQAARYYSIQPDRTVRCSLCPHECSIASGKAGFCKVRQHRDGKLLATNYGQVASMALDPIEKKPLYHYYPGHTILSVGTIGCNLACRFCQNWHISRENAPTEPLRPEELRDLAVRAHQVHGSIGLAYTYSEPGVWFEFLTTVMPLIHEAGLKNVLVTNGFLQPEPWQELLQWTDAANIDLKGFSDEYYRTMCSGKLDPVLANIRLAVQQIPVELTTLVIPGENDAPRQIDAMAQWIAQLDPKIPLHLSRYFPNYQMTVDPTPLETMAEAYRIAKAHLPYVYLGNLGGTNDTLCPACGAVWVERSGYQTKVNVDETCRNCGRKTDLIFH